MPRPFKQKEAFLITALSCNRHTGWNPALHDRLPHPRCCGPDKNGDAFIHVKNMERILHGCGLPITWFIDPPVASEHKEFFQKGRDRFGDEIAFMPSSFSHFNPVNYNTDKTYEETLQLVRSGKEQLENLFGTPVRTLAVDQFIGSLGTHFVNAAARLGINALWGMGFDHFTCDTSMFHGGCPWNPYRPDRKSFRIPGSDPLSPWIFQWTFRDLINTVRTPGGASGAVMFSTDVDDILATGIAANQKDYYHRLIAGFLENRSRNDCLVVTIHQEDHDSWNREGCEYYQRLFSSLPGGLTPATMGEVADWLDRKYPHPENMTQTLRLEDPLTCKDQVTFIHPDVRKPPDWPARGETYPPHVFHYDKARQLIFVEGENAPLRFIDYTGEYNVPENETWPPRRLPAIRVTRIETRPSGLSLEIESDGDCESYPLAIWNEKPPPEGAVSIPGGYVVFLNLKKGMNRLELS